MTARRLVFADPGEAAGLAVFLERLLRWEKAAAVRLQAGAGVLGVFARPARFEVLAVTTARLLEPAELDTTVSAGELLERIDEPTESVTVPGEVTGPAWAGLLPPRHGWQISAELPGSAVREAAKGAIAEFRVRAERLTPEQRTREQLDALAAEIWDRPLDGSGSGTGGTAGTGGTGIRLRAAHAAHALGFLRDTSRPVGLYGSGGWLRLRTAYGSVIMRGTPGEGKGPGLGLSVTPV